MGFLKDVDDTLGFFTAPVGKLFRDEEEPRSAPEPPPKPRPATKVQCDRCYEKYADSHDSCPFCALRKQVGD